jgi:hypothetical protein
VDVQDESQQNYKRCSFGGLDKLHREWLGRRLTKTRYLSRRMNASVTQCERTFSQFELFVRTELIYGNCTIIRHPISAKSNTYCPTNNYFGRKIVSDVVLEPGFIYDSRSWGPAFAHRAKHNCLQLLRHSKYQHRSTHVLCHIAYAKNVDLAAQRAKIVVWHSLHRVTSKVLIHWS